MLSPGCLGGDGTGRGDPCDGETLIEESREIAPGATAVSSERERTIEIHVAQTETGADPSLTIESPVGERPRDTHLQQTIDESLQLTDEGEYRIRLANEDEAPATGRSRSPRFRRTAEDRR